MIYQPPLVRGCIAVITLDHSTPLGQYWEWSVIRMRITRPEALQIQQEYEYGQGRAAVVIEGGKDKYPWDAFYARRRDALCWAQPRGRRQKDVWLRTGGWLE